MRSLAVWRFHRYAGIVERPRENGADLQGQKAAHAGNGRTDHDPFQYTTDLATTFFLRHYALARSGLRGSPVSGRPPLCPPGAARLVLPYGVGINIILTSQAEAATARPPNVADDAACSAMYLDEIALMRGTGALDHQATRREIADGHVRPTVVAAQTCLQKYYLSLFARFWRGHVIA